VSYQFNSPWLGVLAAGCVGLLMGIVHAVICNLPRVNYVAVGIALMMFGMGLSWYLGNSYIGKKADRLPSLDFGFWSSTPQLQDALRINVLFIIGAILAPVLWWMLANTRWGLVLRLAGESEEAAAAMGYSVNRIRIVATALGGFLAGVAGSYLSLYFPGSWNEQISTGQGLMAVALVIFARWNPNYCLLASLLFGGVGSVGRVFQTVGWSSQTQTYLWDTAPYVLTLVIMIITSSRARAMAGAPLELSRVR
jgi:simple sugar transport system permease protein